MVGRVISATSALDDDDNNNDCVCELYGVNIILIIMHWLVWCWVGYMVTISIRTHTSILQMTRGER